MPSPGGSTHAGHHADQLAGRTDHLVAWQGARAVGYGVINWAGDRDPGSRAELPGCPEISNLHVDVAVQGQGIGTALLVEAQSRILARGCARCCVGVSPDNIVAARLYARLGYRRTGIRYVDRYQLPAAGGAVTGFADEVDVLVKDLGGAV